MVPLFEEDIVVDMDVDAKTVWLICERESVTVRVAEEVIDLVPAVLETVSEVLSISVPDADSDGRDTVDDPVLLCSSVRELDIDPTDFVRELV